MHRPYLILILIYNLTAIVSAQRERPDGRKSEDPNTWVWNIPDAMDHVIHDVIYSESMDREVGYNVYLPPSYSHMPVRDYSVVYYLHGAGGDEKTSAYMMEIIMPEMQSRSIEEAIFVFVNGGHWSLYRDSDTSYVKSESHLIKELIPAIDKRYRTIPDRDGRAIFGFSMGGGGSMRLALKYPELFCAAGSFSGALNYARNQDTGEATTAQIIYPNDNVHHWAVINQEKIRNLMGIFLTVGGSEWLYDNHPGFLERLRSLEINFDHVVRGDLTHNLGRSKDLFGARMVQFLGDHYSPPIDESIYESLLKETNAKTRGSEESTASLREERTALNSLKGYVVDDTEARFSGKWFVGGRAKSVHLGYRSTARPELGDSEATFATELPYVGEYEVQVAYNAEPGNASNVPVLIECESGGVAASLDQRVEPETDGHFEALGTFRFDRKGSVTVSNRGADGTVTVDAVRWVLKRYDDPRERWSKDLARWAKEDAEKGGLKGGILFMGSSSILMWDFKEHFPGTDTRGRGFGGSKIWELPILYDEIVEPHEPENIVIYTCENDLSIGRSNEDLIVDWKVLYGRIRDNLPNAQIFFLTVKRSPRRANMSERIVAFNRILKSELSGMPSVSVIDGDTPLIGSDGDPDAGLFRDGLHLNEKGYRIWTKLLTDAMAKREETSRVR